MSGAGSVWVSCVGIASAVVGSGLLEHPMAAVARSTARVVVFIPAPLLWSNHRDNGVNCLGSYMLIGSLSVQPNASLQLASLMHVTNSARSGSFRVDASTSQPIWQPPAVDETHPVTPVTSP